MDIDLGAAVILVLFLGLAGGVFYLFAGQLISGRYRGPSERRRDRRHKPLN